MKTTGIPIISALVLAFLWQSCPSDGRPLTIGGNTTGDSFDPISGGNYSEMRSRLAADFAGTSFTSLPSITAPLAGFDLIVLNRFHSLDLSAAEQIAIRNYVLNGGNLLYVGESIGGVSNDTFTLPFGIGMAPDLSTNVSLALAAYANAGHPFLTGPFGAPQNPPSGSFAAQITIAGPSVEMARWNGGGIAISAFDRNTLGPGAGFGIFLTDVNMMTPGRYSSEVGPMVSNALTVPEPSVVMCLAMGALICIRRRQSAHCLILKSYT